METIETVIKVTISILIMSFFAYILIGTSTRVEEIKERAVIEIPQRGWKIMRYEGYEFGSVWNHGGKVWYHVQNTDNPSIQYRVYITLWNDELHYHYGKPEELNRLNVDIKP